MKGCQFKTTSGVNEGKICDRKIHDKRVPYCISHLRSESLRSSLIKQGTCHILISEIINGNKVDPDNNKIMFSQAMKTTKINVFDSVKNEMIDDDTSSESSEIVPVLPPIKNKILKESNIDKPENNVQTDNPMQYIAQLLINMLAEDLESVVPGSKNIILQHPGAIELVNKSSAKLEEAIDLESLPPFTKLSFAVVNEVLKSKL